MKLIFYALFVFFLISTNGLADTINGFDGFQWGASRNDIFDVRGAPDNFGNTQVDWTKIDDESVGGFSIWYVSYSFKEGCSKLQTSTHCYLWGGGYVFTSKLQSDFDALTGMLIEKYGKYVETRSIDPKIDYTTKKALGNSIVVRRSWVQPDESSVLLYVHSYSGGTALDGINDIGLYYYSSEHNKTQARKETIKKKEF